MSAPSPLAVSKPSESTTYTLLVVDDNEMNRDLMSVQFGRAGYKVVLAHSGYDALELIETSHFDLVLLDMMMPGLSGLDVLHEIRKQYSILNLPVIIVTADDLEQSIITALQAGANDYLTKPLNLAVALARVKTQLTSKNLADLKDEFVRFASHDLKKPLIVIQDIAAEIQRSCHPGDPIPQDIPELLDLVQRTCDNMRSVIDGFLNVENTGSSSSDPKFSEVNINELVSKTIQANESYARQKGIKIRKILADNLLPAHCDEFQISQVLDNLIGNAMKFSPRETVTTIRTGVDGSNVYVEIRDEGPGLTEDDMEKLFTRYAELSNKPTGNETSTGIGLSMSKQFIDQNKGQICAKNNSDRGSTFWFSIPACNSK